MQTFLSNTTKSIVFKMYQVEIVMRLNIQVIAIAMGLFCTFCVSTQLEAGVIAGARGISLYTVKPVEAPNATEDTETMQTSDNFTGANILGLPGQFGVGQGANTSDYASTQSDPIYSFVLDESDETMTTCEIPSGAPGETFPWNEMDIVIRDDVPEGWPTSNASNFRGINSTLGIGGGIGGPSTGTRDPGGSSDGDGPPVLTPEPMTLSIIGLGFAGLLLGRRRKIR